MSVRGSAETVDLVDLLNLIHSSGHAGTLKLRAGERTHRLHFFRGLIYLPTGGSRGAYKIGALLVRANKLSGKDLLRALTVQKQEGHKERLGDLLVRHNLVARSDLDAVIRSQFEEEICDLLFEEGAEYEFRKDILPAGFIDAQGNILALGFDIRSILMEASRRQDEWRMIRSVVPSGRSHLILARHASGSSWQIEADSGRVSAKTETKKQHPDPAAEIAARWAKLHSLFESNPFDGTRSVDEIVGASGVSAFAAMGLVAELIRDGLIRELKPEEIEEHALEGLKRGRKRLSYKLLEWANEADHLRATASRLDSVLLRPEPMDGMRFQSKTSSVRALQILSRMLRRDAPFHYTCREGESLVEVFYTPTSLRLHLMGPRRTHSTTRYLKRRKALSGSRLAQARETAKLERRNLDQVLLEDGYVDREQWIKAVKDKVVSGLFSIFGWSDPYVEVHGGVIPPPAPEDVNGLVCEIPLNPRLKESLRRDLLRWKVLLKEIPTPDVVCVVAKPTPDSKPRRAHDLFNGRRTVGDLIQLARVAPLELVRFIYDSIQGKKVRPLTEREHYDRIERRRKDGRLDEAILFIKSAIGWGYASQLYMTRLKELRKLLSNAPNTELRPVLQGDVSTFSLAEVLQLLHQGKRSGTLRIQDGSRERSLYLDHGDLYVLKVEQSESDQEVWDLLLGDETRSSLDLGDLLKRRGLIEQNDLTAAELQSVKDDLFDSFLWEGATYEFTMNLLPTELREDTARATKVKLNTPMLLMEAMSHLAEWDELRKVLKSSRAVFRYASPAAQLEAVKAGLGATAYLYDGKHSLGDVVRISGENRFKVYRQAKELVEGKQLVFQVLKPKPGRARRPTALASGRLPRLSRLRTDSAMTTSQMEFDLPASGLISSDLEVPPYMGDSMGD